MESPTGIIPENLIDRGMRKDAFNYVLALPIPADTKQQLWAGWRAVTGAKFDQGEYTLLAASGWEAR